MYKSGTDLLVRQSQSLFIVTSGLVKVTYTDPFKDLQEYFLASGIISARRNLHCKANVAMEATGSLVY